jgi:uncharacterized membrane protein
LVVEQDHCQDAVRKTAESKESGVDFRGEEAMTEPKEGNPANGDAHGLARIIESNIRTMVRLRLAAARSRGVQDRIADAVTAFSGRMVFVYVHVLWFAAWVLLNTGWLSRSLGIEPFDPFPYGLLTMIVSLEAIFLSTFVLISQNRFSMEAERRADLALHTGLLTEHELTRALQMLDAIQDKLGIPNDEDQDLADLEMETRPEDVLAEIDRLQRRAHRLRRTTLRTNESVEREAS